MTSGNTIATSSVITTGARGSPRRSDAESSDGGVDESGASMPQSVSRVHERSNVTP
jgi:hypothetical protein